MQVISSVRFNSLPRNKLLELATGKDPLLLTAMRAAGGLYRAIVEHDESCAVWINSYHRGGGAASCNCSPNLIVQELGRSQEEVSGGQ